MIITVSLVTIYYQTYLHIFCLVMGTFKTYSLSDLQIHKVVLLTIVTML